MKSKLVVVAGGTGKVGRLIVAQLLSHPNVRIRVLARNPQKSEAAVLAQSGIEIIQFDVEKASSSEWDAALAGSFGVISALLGGRDIIVDSQMKMLRSAKAQGARHFIPSDFGYNFFSLPQGIDITSDWRRDFAQRAKKEASDSFDVTHIMQGVSLDRENLEYLDILDLENGLIKYWGDGKTPIDWMTWLDTVRFTAAVALDDDKVPAHFFISGERMDILSFADAWESVHGKVLKRVCLGSLPDLKKESLRRQTLSLDDISASFPLMFASVIFGGQALLGPICNPRYPSIQAKTVRQAMLSLA